MKTADDIFKNNKWVKIETDYYVVYEKHYDEKDCTVAIAFDKKTKQVEIATANNNMTPVITVELHIAIHFKLIELGWLNYNVN